MYNCNFLIGGIVFVEVLCEMGICEMSITHPFDFYNSYLWRDLKVRNNKNQSIKNH